MYRFTHEVLNQVRSQSQALADLLARHENMDRDHPERAKMARMIVRLEAEIAARGERRFDLRPAA